MICVRYDGDGCVVVYVVANNGERTHGKAMKEEELTEQQALILKASRAAAEILGNMVYSSEDVYLVVRKRS